MRVGSKLEEKHPQGFWNRKEKRSCRSFTLMIVKTKQTAEWQRTDLCHKTFPEIPSSKIHADYLFVAVFFPHE